MSFRRGGWVVALVCLVLLLVGCARQPEANGTSAVVTLDRAEAVAADWNSRVPPETGWVPVTLMDFWTSRWPAHDGVVWYRLHWQRDATEPAGLLIHYVCMADAVWVNGRLVARNSQLVEPLTRQWVEPQHVLLDSSLLHQGENTILIRVSGLSAYQPGLGKVTVGEPEAVLALYKSDKFWRTDIRQFNFAISTVLGVLFLLFWLLRRKETTFGWYALGTLMDAGYSANFVVTSPWPFASTDAWQAMCAALFFAGAVAFCIFLLRFCGHRLRRVEPVLLALAGIALVLSLLAPHVMGVWRNLWILPGVIIDYVATLVFLWYAVRTPRPDVRVLALSVLLPTLAATHDLAVYMHWIHSSRYDLGAVTASLSMLGIGFALAWRFSTAMRRVEGFNLELKDKVDAATTHLSATLSREHELALANTRASERLNFVRDLHDGFGGSLIATITQLQMSPASDETTRTIETLKKLREDLRLVIDTTIHDQEKDLAALLAPLRRRWGERLELTGIQCRWRIDGLDGCHLGPARSLDLLRFVQECLTNVLKHSEAGQVDVSVSLVPEGLELVVHDNGKGFDLSTCQTAGAGLGSMEMRGRRLGGQLRIDTVAQRGTRIGMTMPLAYPPM